jgi:hypothetical protein
VLTDNISVTSFKANGTEQKLVKGETYLSLKVPYQEAILTEAAALEVAMSIVDQLSGSYTIINLKSKRDDPLTRTPVDAPNTNLIER